MFEKKLVKKLIFDEGEIETLIQENYKCIVTVQHPLFKDNIWVA